MKNSGAVLNVSVTGPVTADVDVGVVGVGVGVRAEAADADNVLQLGLYVCFYIKTVKLKRAQGILGR